MLHPYTFSDSFRILPIQSRQSDLITMLTKFQNVSYDTHNISIKSFCNCTNTFVSYCVCSLPLNFTHLIHPGTVISILTIYRNGTLVFRFQANHRFSPF